MKQNFLWNSMGNLVYLFFQWLLALVVVRISGYASAGVFSVSMSIGVSLSAIALFNMRSFQVSDVRGEFSDRIYALSRLVTSALSLIVCLLFVLLSRYDAATSGSIIIYMLFKITEAVSDVLQGIMQKNLRMDYIGKSFVMKGIVGFVAFTGILQLTHQILMANFALFISSAVVVLTYESTIARRMTQTDELPADHKSAVRALAGLLKFCVPIAIYSFLINLIVQIPRLQLESMYGAEPMGYYASIAMPVTIIQVSANYIIVPLTTPLAVHVSNGRYKCFTAMVSKALAVVGGLSVLAIALYFLFGELVFILLFGASIRPYVYLGLPLIICGILTALCWFSSMLFIVLRKTVSLLIVSIISFACSYLSSAPLLGALGLNGASVAQVFAMIVFLLGSVVVLIPLIRGRVRTEAGSDADLDATDPM